MSEQAVRDRIRQYPVTGTPAKMREAFRRLADLPVSKVGVSCLRQSIAGLPVLTITPDHSSGPAIVHCHGGGYVFGSPDTHKRLAIVLARASGCIVHLPHYPLAPEHPWPAQREALLPVLRSVMAQQELVLCGDSAGGHLALCCAQRLPRGSVRSLVLFSPNTLRDYAQSRSREHNRDLDIMCNPEQDDLLARMAFGASSPTDRDQNPALDDLSALPPLYIDVGLDEVLLDDSLLLARRAGEADVPTHLHTEPQAFHLRQLFAQHYDAADRSLETAGTWIRDQR